MVELSTLPDRPDVKPLKRHATTGFYVSFLLSQTRVPRKQKPFEICATNNPDKQSILCLIASRSSEPIRLTRQTCLLNPRAKRSMWRARRPWRSLPPVTWEGALFLSLGHSPHPDVHTIMDHHGYGVRSTEVWTQCGRTVCSARYISHGCNLFFEKQYIGNQLFISPCLPQG